MGGFWERWSGLLGGAMLALALLLGFWQLLGEGEDLEARDSRGGRTPPLIVAAEEGETDRVAELVERGGARVDAGGDDCNWTA